MKTIKKEAPKGAMDRIKDLEVLVDNLGKTDRAVLEALNQVIMQTNDRLNSVTEITNVMAEHLGADTIKTLLEAKRARDAVERVEKAKEMVRQMVEAGKILPVENIGEKSLVVGVEYDQEGNPVAPGHVQVPFEKFLPDIKEQLLGKGVGARVDAADGVIFEVLEIYDDAPKTETAPEMAG